MTHILRCWPEYMSEIQSRRKKFELRLNDRDYEVGDILHLHEFDPSANLATGTGYNGNETRRRVAHILYGPKFGLAEGWCCMSISDIEESI